MPTRKPRPARGAALLEVMAGLSVLAIGLVGMFHLQMLGITANQGSRATTKADLLARDLLAALERAPLLDVSGNLTPAFTPTVTSSTAPPPAPFGQLLTGPATISTNPGIHDGTVVANLPADALREPPGGRDVLEIDPTDSTKPLYQRRWTVWKYTPAGSTVPVYLVAVSVIYREAKLPRLREIVVYTQKFDQGAVIRNVLGSL